MRRTLQDLRTLYDAQMNTDRLTVVVAARNEEQALPSLQARLRRVLDAMEDLDSTILYVDDGSSDATWRVMQQLAAEDSSVHLLRLSRNFGKEAALTAGLDHVADGAAMILDADGQDPPELIPQFVARWREGFDDIHGRRVQRDGDSLFKRGAAYAFYRIIGRLSRTPVPRDTGDFRLLSARSLAALRQMRERHRFMKGLFGWVGFRQTEITYHRDPRVAGTSNFSLWKLWNFAVEGITSFSTVPLRAATYLGVMTALVAFAYALFVVVKAVFWGDPVAGWPSLMAVILLLGGIQLIALGVIGEYLGRLYAESKQRPLYLVDAWQPASGVSSGRPSPAGDAHAYGATASGSEESRRPCDQP